MDKQRPAAKVLSRYTFAEYSASWPLAFVEEAERLRGLLGDVVVDVHHIGSTSVPGLAAKPTIDLLSVVRSTASFDDQTRRLCGDGYVAWGEYGLSGRQLFTKDRDGFRTHNIHFYPAGHPDIERHVSFREYLRHHDERRAEYETLKRAAYERHPADINAYNDDKDAWIKNIEPLAREWYRRQDS